MNLRIASLVAGLGVSLAVSAVGQGLEERRSSFLSGGTKIGLEAFISSSKEPQPAIIVIHGAGGLEYGNGYIRQLATAFAANGISTYLIHYFDRTGHSWADDATIYKNFATWLDTVGDAVRYVREQPGVDQRRVALFGYSLGAYLAVAEGARDPQIGAVVELAGGIDPSYAVRTEHMPPTLILHGDSDRRVLPARAKELEELLRKLGTPYEMQMYQGEGHVLSPAAALDALARGMTFLGKHLH
ncbi:dienelactone hydrolase family protein [Verrucomicrobiota bacterium sgz303538]